MASVAFRVREAARDDVDRLVAFNAAMALETERRRLDRKRLRRGVESVFANEERGRYFVVEDSSRRVVGGLLVTYEWSDWRNGTFWWIQSVYVAKEARGRGAFRALYDELHRRARAEAGVCGLRLYVEGGNRMAQRVYGGLGMRRTPYRLYEVDFVLAE